MNEHIIHNMVYEMLKELNSRAGFDDWWDGLDYDIQNEIIKELESIAEDFVYE